MTANWFALLLGLLGVVLPFAFARKVFFSPSYELTPVTRALRFLLGLLVGFSLFLVVGAFWYLPGETGSTNSGGENSVSAITAPEPEELTWHTSFEEASQEALKTGRPIIVDVWATWCKPCKALSEKILKDPKVAHRLQHFVRVKLDFDDEEHNGAFLDAHDIGDNLPWVGFFVVKDNQIELRKEKVVVGEATEFGSAESFSVALDALLEEFPPPAETVELGEGWLDDLHEGFAVSKQSGRKLLVDCAADWCASCKDLKNKTMRDPAVKERIKDHVRVLLDMDLLNNEWVWTQYGIKGLPWVAEFEPGEQKTPNWILKDFEPPEAFIARLDGKYSKDSDMAGWLASKGLFLTLLLVFLAGVAASLTPCAYPTYMLVFGFFADSSGEKRSIKSSLLMATLLVLGMVLSFSSAGVVAALGGGAVGRIMTNPWVMGGLALLFISMGASSLQVLPQMKFVGVQDAVHKRQKRNPVWALIFGLVIGLIVAPCVGPILVAILTYIASSQDIGLGIGLMTSFALGMGLLFFLMAFFLESIRSRLRMGKWNEAITVVFGIVFMLAAFYYLKGVLPYDALFESLRHVVGK